MPTTNLFPPARPTDGMVLDALLFATEQHDGQVRRGTDLPYITHPIAVSYLVAQFKRSRHLPELVAAAILHDVLEDPENIAWLTCGRFQKVALGDTSGDCLSSAQYGVNHF